MGDPARNYATICEFFIDIGFEVCTQCRKNEYHYKEEYIVRDRHKQQRVNGTKNDRL